MDDLISRQDAIDAVKSYWKAEVDAIPKDADFGTVTATCDLILKCNTEMCKVLDGIPSAQPERDTGYSDGFADGYKAGQKDAQPEQQWIPVVKKPIEKGLMLATYNDGDVDLLKQPTAYRRSDIVAWMPIEPWRGEEHETY